MTPVEIAERRKRELLLDKHPNSSRARFKHTTPRKFRIGKEREYSTWIGMLSRCFRSGGSSSRYKLAGISVCDRWLLFENFYADMGVRPDGHTLDRINNSKSYSKDNCRWATPVQQFENSSSYRPIKIGDRFGKLVVSGERFSVRKSSNLVRSYIPCKCDCGAECVKMIFNITSGKTKSCGCSGPAWLIGKRGSK